MVVKINRLVLLFVILGSISIVILVDHLCSINRINSGVYLKDVHLGNNSLKQVEEKLHSAEFTFVGPDRQAISIPLREMGIELDCQQIFETGYQLSPSKGWFQSFLPLKKEKVFVPFRYHINRQLLSQSIDFVVGHFAREPQNAYFKVFDDKQVELMPEKFGYRFDHDDIEHAVLTNLAQLDTPLTIIVPFAEKTPPQVTASFLKEKGIRDLMISFSTGFDPTLTTRVHNIELAASKINNYLLEPGDVFSFNKTIGNPTAKKGYKLANVIVGNKLVPGIGGGICQISSTLYNAAVLADLEIVERYSHRLTVPYIDPGRDATVSYASKDLSFRNNKDHYILILAFVENEEFTIRLFGQPLDVRVEIKTNVLETYPPPKKSHSPKGVVIEAYPGYLVEVWKTVYRGEKKEKEERISVDKYAPFEIEKKVSNP